MIAPIIISEKDTDRLARLRELLKSELASPDRSPLYIADLRESIKSYEGNEK